MGNIAKLDLKSCIHVEGRSPLPLIIKKLPLTLLFPLSQASGLAPETLAQIEQRLGACMKYLTETEGHEPALAKQVQQALASGMKLRQIAFCLDIEEYDALRLSGYSLESWRQFDESP